MNYEERGINSALAIVMSNGRYFRGFNKAGGVSTAWSLAGSVLYLNENDKSFIKTVKQLTDKKSKFEVKNVQLVGHSTENIIPKGFVGILKNVDNEL